jgi:hypothetical protein
LLLLKGIIPAEFSQSFNATVLSKILIMEDHLVAKIVSMCILGGVSLFLGLLPIKLVDHLKSSDKNAKSKSNNRTQLFLTALNCFGAGVILTTCFTHMLPEVNEFVQTNVRQGTISTNG